MPTRRVVFFMFEHVWENPACDCEKLTTFLPRDGAGKAARCVSRTAYIHLFCNYCLLLLVFLVVRLCLPCCLCTDGRDDEKGDTMGSLATRAASKNSYAKTCLLVFCGVPCCYVACCLPCACAQTDSTARRKTQCRSWQCARPRTRWSPRDDRRHGITEVRPSQAPSLANS